MPAPVRDIMRAAYGDATAEIFLISAVIAVVALIAVLFIKERPLRRTVDIQPEAEHGSEAADGGTRRRAVTTGSPVPASPPTDSALSANEHLRPPRTAAGRERTLEAPRDPGPQVSVRACYGGFSVRSRFARSTAGTPWG